MTQDTSARAVLIHKLLHKAEAKGTTTEEREAFNAKARELMVQWSIDDAMLAAAAGTAQRIEKIVQREFSTDAPKSYSFEMTTIGCKVAEAMSCRGLLQRKQDGRTNLLVVGYESDVDRVGMLFQSLTLQCTLELGPWYRNWCAHAYYPSGTDKFNAKRAFISGYALGVNDKFKVTMNEVLKNAEPGTDLVLVDRKAQVTHYVDTEMSTGASRVRRYVVDGSNAGYTAGLRSDIGGSRIGGSRPAVER